MEDTPNKSLPFELEVEILIRLPMKSVVRFKCVSKHWLSLITSQSFVNQYLNINGCRDNCFLLIRSSSISDFVYSGDRGIVSRVSMPLRYKIDSERDIIGSSNGLLCFNNPSNACISVYNPITRDHKAVPYSRLASNIRTSGLPILLDGRKIGFGYDHKSNGFKILLLVNKDNLSYIYRLRNDSYEKVNHSSVFNWHYSDFIVYSNNALHKKFWRSVPKNGHSVGIAAFDLGTEQFYEVELPRRISSYSDWNITDLRGLLHLVTYGDGRVSRGVQECSGVDVWVMKEYGVKSSWTRLLRCSYDKAMILFRRESTWRQLQIYAYSDDQRSVLIGFGRFNNLFYSCDLRTKEVNKIGALTNCTNFHNGWIDRLHFAPWSPSFVSP